MVYTKGRKMPSSSHQDSKSPFASTEKNKSTLPTQALSCSGSKGLSQPAPVNNPNFASGVNRASKLFFELKICISQFTPESLQLFDCLVIK